MAEEMTQCPDFLQTFSWLCHICYFSNPTGEVKTSFFNSILDGCDCEDGNDDDDDFDGEDDSVEAEPTEGLKEAQVLIEEKLSY